MRYRIFLTVLSSLFLLCYTDTVRRYKVLSFFFDGVPKPPLLQQKDSLELMKIDSSTFAWDSLTGNMRPKNEIARYFHEPFLKKMCSSCHIQQFMGDLIKPANMLCFDCHEEFSKLPGFVHGPVAAGNCTICHHPHYSYYRNRAIREGDFLCTYCHGETDTTSIREHEKIADVECITCHDPHFSEGNNFLVRKDSVLK